MRKECNSRMEPIILEEARKWLPLFAASSPTQSQPAMSQPETIPILQNPNPTCYSVLQPIMDLKVNEWKTSATEGLSSMPRRPSIWSNKRFYFRSATATHFGESVSFRRSHLADTFPGDKPKPSEPGNDIVLNTGVINAGATGLFTGLFWIFMKNWWKCSLCASIVVWRLRTSRTISAIICSVILLTYKYPNVMGSTRIELSRILYGTRRIQWRRKEESEVLVQKC